MPKASPASFFPSRGARSRAGFLAAAAVFTTSFFGGCTRVDAIYIVPQEVWAPVGVKFTLRVRPVDEEGKIFPDDRAAGVRWETGPGLSVSRRSGATTVVTTASPLEPLTSYVRVKRGWWFCARSDSIPVYVGFSSAGMYIDWVQAPRSDPEPPTIGLVDGISTSMISDTLVAFIGQGPVDDLRCDDPVNCGEVTLFSRNYRITRDTIDWTPPSALGGSAVLQPPRNPVVSGIYVLVPGDVANKIMDKDVPWAHKVLADNWTGLTVNLVTHPIVTEPGGTSIILGWYPEIYDSCTLGLPTGVKKVAQQLIDVGVPSTAFQPDRITVAYVGSLWLVDELDPSEGFTCPWNAEDGRIVLMPWPRGKTPTMLAHELLHAIGPWDEYPYGHTNGVEGFTSTNVLWEGEHKQFPRSHISLGQAFRLSLAKGGLFDRATGTGVPCEVDDYRDWCPLWAKDVVGR
jgi:hypothetical protein